MMKHIIIIALYIVSFSLSGQAPVVIIESDSSGIQIPIVQQSAILNPTEGLIIYNSDNQLVEWWDREGF